MLHVGTPRQDLPEKVRDSDELLMQWQKIEDAARVFQEGVATLSAGSPTLAPPPLTQAESSTLTKLSSETAALEECLKELKQYVAAVRLFSLTRKLMKEPPETKYASKAPCTCSARRGDS